MLEGVGDEKRQRLFRMCVTTCIHRAVTPAEEVSLPESFHSGEAIDIAGGPVEILEESEPGLPSTRPCMNPTMVSLDDMLGHAGRIRGAKFAQDCGECEPCRARERCSANPNYPGKQKSNG